MTVSARQPREREIMDLIPPYSYLETGYGPGGGGGSGYPDTAGEQQVRRQRVLSGERDRDRVVILPRRPSETESPDYVMPPRDMQQQQPRRQDWRVPPHYPPDYAMPGESCHHHPSQFLPCRKGMIFFIPFSVNQQRTAGNNKQKQRNKIVRMRILFISSLDFRFLFKLNNFSKTGFSLQRI